MHYELADVVSRPKSAFDLIAHKGIVVGFDAVFHNTPERGEHISTLREFANGKRVSIIKRHPHPAQRHAILRRIRQQLAAPRGHDVFGYNCEHSVSRVLGLPAQSEQLRTWLAFAAIATLAMAASRA